VLFVFTFYTSSFEESSFASAESSALSLASVLSLASESSAFESGAFASAFAGEDELVSLPEILPLSLLCVTSRLLVLPLPVVLEFKLYSSRISSW
jgi:hypothetical protein